MGQLEPWEVSLGGEHYLFPEMHYFMNISINNLISLCDPSSPVLPCIHCCLGSPSLRAISRVRRDFPVAWGENLFRTGKSSVINYFPKTCWSANHTGAAGTWVKHIINIQQTLLRNLTFHCRFPLLLRHCRWGWSIQVAWRDEAGRAKWWSEAKPAQCSSLKETKLLPE